MTMCVLKQTVVLCLMIQQVFVNSISITGHKFGAEGANMSLLSIVSYNPDNAVLYCAWAIARWALDASL